MQWSLIKKLFFAPLLRRLGTYVSGALLMVGVNAELSSQLVTALATAMFIGFDLFVSAVTKSDNS